jgi:phenylalanine-4-hydroxylase
MRTPYRIDILQPLYFVLPDLKRLFELAQEDIMPLVQQAMNMGLHALKFTPKTTLLLFREGRRRSVVHRDTHHFAV